MITLVQPGEVLKFTAPTGGVVTGGAYLIGSLLVIAAESVAETLPFSGVTRGVFSVPRVDSEAWAEGEKIYYEAETELFTNDEMASPTPVLVGVSVETIDASPAVATGRVRLDGVAR